MCFISSRALPCIRLRAGVPPVEVTPPRVTSSDLSSCNSEHNYTDRRPRPSSKVGSGSQPLAHLPPGPAGHIRLILRVGTAHPGPFPAAPHPYPPVYPVWLCKPGDLTVKRACAFLSQGRHAHTEGDIGRGNFASDISGTDPVMPQE